MNPNVKPSEQVGVLAYLPPASVDATTAVLGASGERIDMQDVECVLIAIHVGAMTTNATLNAKVRSYSVASGGSPVDVTGKAITALTEAGGDDDQVVLIDVRREDLAEGQRYIDLLITTAVAAVIVGAVGLGFYANYGPGAGLNIDEVAEVV